MGPAGVMLSAAAMLQPAHQGGIRAGHLHTVNAQVVAVLGRPTRPLGDDQGPGDERRRLARPAGLDRQRGQIDVVTLEHDLLAGRGFDGLGLHGHDFLDQGQHGHGVAQSPGRFGLLEEGQGLADLAQLIGLAVHAPGDPLDGAEQIDQHGHSGTNHILEQHGGAALGDQPGLDLGHLEIGRDRLGNPHQPPVALEAGHEVSQ